MLRPLSCVESTRVREGMAGVRLGVEEVGVSGCGSWPRGESGGLKDNEEREKGSKGREEKNLLHFETHMEER